MAAGLDPFAASMLRVGVAAVCLTVLIALPIPAVKPKGPLTWRVAALTALTGILALAIGMTLLLFALSGGKVGIVSTLSATSPVIILPMLWARSGSAPPPAPGRARRWWSWGWRSSSCVNWRNTRAIRHGGLKPTTSCGTYGVSSAAISSSESVTDSAATASSRCEKLGRADDRRGDARLLEQPGERDLCARKALC